MNRKRVIILYGPPGVGKLTVGQALAKKTGLKLFHVHLLADLVSSLFDTGTKDFVDTFIYLWLFLFRKALSGKNQGLIATLIYGIQTRGGKNDAKFFAQISRLARASQAEIIFIKLKCADRQLHRRIRSKSRKKFGELTDPRLVEAIRRKYQVDQTIPFGQSITIDTTKISAIQTAAKIVNILNLKK